MKTTLLPTLSTIALALLSAVLIVIAQPASANVLHGAPQLHRPH
jgi:hypothetical protein